MSDWLTKLEAQKRAQEDKRQAHVSKEESERRKREQTEQNSYERNKVRIERIYDDLTKYAKRTSDAGFTVSTTRLGHYGFVVVGTFSSAAQ